MIIALAVQLELGAVNMAKPTDCTYADQHLAGNNADFDYVTKAGGLSLRLDADKNVVTIGWRELGRQSIAHAGIEPDANYGPCGVGAHPGAGPQKVTSVWDSSGSESQLFASYGRKYALGAGYLVPTVGLGVNTITWSIDSINGCPKHLGSPAQHRPNPFAGIDYERGRFGVGAYLLMTRPYTESNVDGYFPGQGALAGYLRVTVRLGGAL